MATANMVFLGLGISFCLGFIGSCIVLFKDNTHVKQRWDYPGLSDFKGGTQPSYTAEAGRRATPPPKYDSLPILFEQKVDKCRCRQCVNFKAGD